MAIGYESEDHALSHTTLWRFLACLGAMTISLSIGVKLFQEVFPESNIHRYEGSVFPSKHRSDSRAWSNDGSSVQLYADNGKVYHSKALEIACGQLAITKLHRPPREPQPGGLIERFFRTVQSQFEAEVRAMKKALSLSELNRAFTAWLISAYHEQINRETNIVHSTFSDVVLKNSFYQVDPKFRGLGLRVCLDPFIDESRMPDRVELYSEQGVLLGVGRRYAGYVKSALVRRFIQDVCHKCVILSTVTWPNCRAVAF